MFEKSILFGSLFTWKKKYPSIMKIQCLLPEFGKISTINVSRIIRWRKYYRITT
jgi:hypothetical protein